MLKCLCRFQLDELREIIVQLESEQESLTRRLLQKDHQMEALQKSLTAAQQQLASKQHKLDKVWRHPFIADFAMAKA
jgi:chromosome segregation ATPase